MNSHEHTPPPNETIATIAREEARIMAQESATAYLEGAFKNADLPSRRFDNHVEFVYVNGWGVERVIRLTVTAEVVG